MYMYVCHSALEPAVDEYGQLQQRLQIEQGCRSEAEKYACKVIDFLNSDALLSLLLVSLIITKKLRNAG